MSWKEIEWGRLYRLTVAVAIYYIWNERNNRIFKMKCRSPQAITRMVIQEIHVQASGMTKLVGYLRRFNFYPGGV
ncbi:hypothetical protein H5410_030014 [Solanum commersonii]|uniref:Uncharacterized protein n=1 Tax=Solanum commersonii TaxID=4109 RepID=A0A9J5YHD8_SOLCO|nr:hypothetical protein H5410_030014 [Solanum commersonii]